MARKPHDVPSRSWRNQNHTMLLARPTKGPEFPAMASPGPGGLAGAFFGLSPVGAPLRDSHRASEPLLVVPAHHPASTRMNEVHLPTRLATHGLIGLAGFIGPIVRDLALDAKASIWAAEEEGRHRSASQRTTVGALRWINWPPWAIPII